MKNYDIVIIGGGTAGCACAWCAAKLGLKTLLIEKKSYLGGAITSQLVVPTMKTEQNDLNTAFYEELVGIANSKKAQITYKDGNTGWFNPLKLPDILQDMLKDVGCEVILEANIHDVRKNIDTKQSDNILDNQQKILSIYVATKYNDNIQCNKNYEAKYNDNVNDFKEEIFSKFFVDATGDGIFSEKCGAKFLQDKGSQALSLRFIMAGIDKKSFAEWLLQIDKDREVTTAYNIDGDIHLSTAYTWDTGKNWALKPLFNDAVTEGTLKDIDRAYFQVFSIAGEPDKIAFNCPRIVSNKPLNPLDNKDYNFAYTQGVETIKRIENFCKQYLIGFENAYIYKIADELGVRESRRVKGKYILTKEDIYNAKEFENPIAYSNYPIDVHSITKDNSTLEYVQKVYSVPLESLMVLGFKNLFVVGRCLSADFYAQAATRIQPTCFSMGEGVAKYVANYIL